MAYVYKSLASPLHATADAAIAWFVANWGVKKSAIHVEEPLDPDVNFRPTFSVVTSDFDWLAIEVMDDIYTSNLDSFALDCRDKGLPVKLFVAVQKGGKFADYPRKLKLAKRAGVGILEVDSHSGDFVINALSLSLTGLRKIDLTDFPKRYRKNLQQAEQAFRDGQPAKACSLVYDELEDLFRRFAKRCETKGWWPNSGNKNTATAPWASLITDIDTDLDRGRTECKKVTRQLMARLFGTTPHRNDTGHKPASIKKRIKMEKELSTRFEGAVDLFKDFHLATNSLKL